MDCRSRQSQQSDNQIELDRESFHGHRNSQWALHWNLASIERVGFGGLCLSDGPQGLHLADLASVFPSGVTAAATWDRELIARRGAAMGTEFRDKGANVMLG